MHDVDDRDDEAQSGLAGADHPAEPEEHPLLVLLDDTDRQGHEDRDHGDDGKNDQDDLESGHDR